MKYLPLALIVFLLPIGAAAQTPPFTSQGVDTLASTTLPTFAGVTGIMPAVALDFVQNDIAMYIGTGVLFFYDLRYWLALLMALVMLLLFGSNLFQFFRY